MGAANDLYAMMDGYPGSSTLWARPSWVTADHGMNAKTDASARPNIVFLQDALDRAYGKDTRS